MEQFDYFWGDLICLANQFGEDIGDRKNWREAFELGMCADDAFFEQYPQHEGK